MPVNFAQLTQRAGNFLVARARQRAIFSGQIWQRKNCSGRAKRRRTYINVNYRDDCDFM